MQFATKCPKYAIICVFIMHLATNISIYVWMCVHMYLLRANMKPLRDEWAHNGATSTCMCSKHVTMSFYECCAPTTTPTSSIAPR